MNAFEGSFATTPAIVWARVEPASAGSEWNGGPVVTDEIAVDYGSIGSLVATVPADEWTDRCRTLEGFDATAHQLHNVIATIDGDRATVTSIVDAVHVVGVEDRALLGDLIGRYTHRLVRRDGWKIAGVTLTVVAYPAGKEAFETAFAAARAILSEGNTA